MTERNLTLPGNPRYQPAKLRPILGYDNLNRPQAKVDLSTLDVLADIEVIPPVEYALLTPAMREAILDIPTTAIDAHEKAVTKHDIRAFVELAQQLVPWPIGRWLHIPNTSYDTIDTGRVLLYQQAWREVLKPSIQRVMATLIRLTRRWAEQLQIGRTHLQHALPIKLGFWFATLLSRLLYNYQELERCESLLVGKISGAVGASNAIFGLGFAARCGDYRFENRVLDKLGLKAAPISTQILPPEPVAYFLHAAVMCSEVFGQFGNDARKLMSSEVGEFAEPYSAGQAASSTMGHKRNPPNFEGLVGAAKKNRREYGKVQDTLITDFQRDLVDSALMRDFPVILVNLQSQLDTLSREDDGIEFLERCVVSEAGLERNFGLFAHVILAEPLQIALTMAGFERDAHEFVNHGLVPAALRQRRNLVDVLEMVAREDKQVAGAWDKVPTEIKVLLRNPPRYTGDAAERALKIADMAEAALAA